MKKLATIEIQNKKWCINAVLSFLDIMIQNHQAHDFSRCNKLRFAVGEVLKNRIENAYPNSDGPIWVEFFLSDTFFEVSVKDKGVPAWTDFSYDKNNLTNSKDDFRNYLMDMWLDDVGMEKLGKDGQRVFIRLKILNPVKFKTPKPYEETEALDTNITIRPVANEADAIEAIRCIYSEYGYSYSYERLYYVDNFLNMIKNGNLMSFLAVNDHGQTAGHFALAFSDLYKGMPEISTVVIRKEFRGLKLFSKFMDYSLEFAKKEGFRALMGQPVAFHPMSQKAFIRAGFVATSLLLSYLGTDIESEYNQDGTRRLDLLSSVKIIDSDASCVIYPPKEIMELVEKIYGRLGMKHKIETGTGFGDITEMLVEDNGSLSIRKIIIRNASSGLKSELKNAVTAAIRKKCEMIELMISMRSPACSEIYNTALECGFILSGIIPGAENDDYIVMQILIKNERKYDHLVTVGDYEELKNDIIALAVNEKEITDYEL